MGWRFSKGINFGPLRINFSKSGVGWSVGGKGFRTGVDAKGRKYNSISIPGTGISNRTYQNQGSNQSGQYNQNQQPYQNQNQNQNQSNSESVISWPIVILLFIIFSIVKAYLK